MVEKVIRSLQDLEDALALAAGQGECRIKVGDKEAILIASEPMGDKEASDLLNHPAVVRRLDKAARSLEEGRGIPHPEVCDMVAQGGRRAGSNP